MSGFKKDDVIQYLPDDRHDRWWCREGMAIVEERQDGSTYAVDTYWGSGSESHVLSASEEARSEFLFNLADFREFGQYEHPPWVDYHPDDRKVITSQHRLRIRRLLRNGARPDHSTRIANAEAEVAEAEQVLRSAQHSLEQAQWRLEQLRASEVTS